jgi:glycosyltransferase involved in cell wall biosynthesis
MSSGCGEAAQLITTVIPTFRRARLLKRAVLSALDQNDVPLQVCVFDNASDDDTGDLIAAIAAVDDRIRYHRHARNIGSGANFEFGLHSVATPFFSILSDDDYLIPGFYRRALDDLARYPEAMFWAGVTLNVDEEGNIWDARVAGWPREGLFRPPEGLLRMMHGIHPAWTGILFRREVLDLVGLPDQETLGPSDLDFEMRVAARFPFLLYKVPAAVFTLNSASFSATQPLSSFWPGWQKMFSNLASEGHLEPGDREEALAALHADARRMLFRRGANAIAQGRYDFARDAATALNTSYRQNVRATLLRIFASACGRSTWLGRIYTAAYRLAERRIVRSRVSLQRRYAQFVRPA